MAFTQPTQDKPNLLAQIGTGLQAFGAGVQGRGPEFLALREAQNQALSNERKRAAAEDIRRAKLLYDKNDIAGIADLAAQRVGFIEQLGGDPSDTLGIFELAKASLAGDERAKTRLGSELSAGLQSARDAGFISPDPGDASFNALVQGLSPEDKALAREIKLGLKPRAVGASDKIFDIGGVPHIFDPVSGKATPVEVEGKKVTTDTVKDAKASITEAEERARGTAKTASKAIDNGFTTIGNIRNNILNIDRAIRAIDAGANTGAIKRFFPSIKASTIALEQVQKELGLDVIGSVTFGALSEGELNLALETALPTNLPPEELKVWLQEKREAQQKLSDYYREQIEFLDAGGSVVDFLKGKEGQGVDDAVDRLRKKGLLGGR